MVVQVACRCDDLPAHSHVYRLSVDVDPSSTTTVARYIPDDYDVRIWVDWKEVAREMMVVPSDECGQDGCVLPVGHRPVRDILPVPLQEHASSPWVRGAYMDALDKKIDALHGPGAAATIDEAYADGSIFSDNRKN